ncbi:hypothetical protein P3S68_015709 [Capsicum galapagoense]
MPSMTRLSQIMRIRFRRSHRKLTFYGANCRLDIIHNFLEGIIIYNNNIPREFPQVRSGEGIVRADLYHYPVEVERLFSKVPRLKCEGILS